MRFLSTTAALHRFNHILSGEQRINVAMSGWDCHNLMHGSGMQSGRFLSREGNRGILPVTESFIQEGGIPCITTEFHTSVAKNYISPFIIMQLLPRVEPGWLERLVCLRFLPKSSSSKLEVKRLVGLVTPYRRYFLVCSHGTGSTTCTCILVIIFMPTKPTADC